LPLTISQRRLRSLPDAALRTKQERSTYSKVVQEGEHFSRHSCGLKDTSWCVGFWSNVVTLGKIFGILIFSSLLATGATLAGDISKTWPTLKTWPLPPKGAAASVVVHHVWREAPIVVGRSVSLHHKTKLHHVKDKPLDSNENLTSADGSQ
jgi:hypothetical protein